ncbi:MAG TPA: hypothetical protein VGO74_12900 [Modestobacter sp.]|nr:hypothetical protein [Modestobacter sp.]
MRRILHCGDAGAVCPHPAGVESWGSARVTPPAALESIVQATRPKGRWRTHRPDGTEIAIPPRQ